MDDHDDVDETEAAVEAWELERLLELNVPLAEAEQLARRRVSWHDVDELVRRGCPPATAAAIVA